MFTLTSTYGECTVDLFTLRLEVVGVVGAPLLGLNVQAMTVNAIDGMKYSYLICTNIKRWNEWSGLPRFNFYAVKTYFGFSAT